MSLEKYLEAVTGVIRREEDLSRREALIRYQRFIELAIAEEETSSKVLA
ncbi:MAG TPA: hypothetical protein V6C82_08255 [Chroococcales cyanobacterium]|jgi:hypothetical protein